MEKSFSIFKLKLISGFVLRDIVGYISNLAKKMANHVIISIDFFLRNFDLFVISLFCYKPLWRDSTICLLIPSSSVSDIRCASKKFKSYTGWPPILEKILVLDCILEVLKKCSFFQYILENDKLEYLKILEFYFSTKSSISRALSGCFEV